MSMSLSGSMFLGPLAVLVLCGRDYDCGTRQARYLGGCPPRLLALAQLGAVAILIVATLVVTLAAAAAAGGIDAVLRSQPVTGGDTVARAGLLSRLAVVSWLSLATWALVVIGRSGRLAALTLLVAASSLLVLLVRVDASSVRALLMWHPLAWVWSVVDPFPARMLAIPPHGRLYASGLSWLALLGALAWRKLADPRPR